MFRSIYVAVVVCLTISCHFKSDVTNNCRYDSSTLLNEADTSLLDEKYYPDDQLFEVFDKGSNIGVKGIYKFDKNRTLRFYAFLLSDSNDYRFSRAYDSLGVLIDSTGGEVVQWYFRKVQGDSVKITFYLYGINQTYTDINLQIGTSQKRSMELFKSPIFSNILGVSFTGILDKKRDRKIFVTGSKTHTCSASVYSFVDSTEVPQGLFAK